MSMFPAINTAGTGLVVDQAWINAIGGNIANAEDAVTPGKPIYHDQELVAEESPGPIGPSLNDTGDGVQVQGVVLGSSNGILTYDPTSPLANKQGDVAYPNVNIGSEMSSLVEAQVSYEANSNVLENSDNAYKALLAIKP